MNKLKILIINPFGIGDVIFSTPLIEALKKNHPDCLLGYLCNKRAYEIIKSNPNLYRIFVYEKDDHRILWQQSKVKYFKMFLNFLKTIKDERFDIVIDLSMGYHYSLFSKLIGIKRRIGFNYRNRGKFLTDPIDIDGFESKHVIEYYLDMLTPLGIDPAQYKVRPKTYFTEKDKSWADAFLRDNGIREGDAVVGVIPGCGASWGKDAVCRRWERDKFAKVCDGLVDKHKAKIVLFGDQKELEICADVEKMMSHEPIIACGKTNLGNFLGLARRCDLIVTNDGGPLHMAVGVGVKTVSIFGPVDEKIYGPYPPSPRHIIITSGVKCRPCYKKFKYNICKDMSCLKNIRVEDVLNAADKLLSQEKNSLCDVA